MGALTRAPDKRYWIITLPDGQTFTGKTRKLAAHAAFAAVLYQKTQELETQIQRNRSFRRPSRDLTEEQAGKIYNILVEFAGATPLKRNLFIWSHTEPNGSFEYRFCGYLGFGGKFWNQRDALFVSQYYEHSRSETNYIVAKTNLELEKLYLEEWPVTTPQG